MMLDDEDFARTVGQVTGKEAASSLNVAELNPGLNLSRRADFRRLVGMLPSEMQGSLVLLYVDTAFGLLQARQLGPGPLSEAASQQYEIIRGGLNIGALGFVLLDFGAMSAPSQADCAAMQRLRRLSEEYDCYLFDAFSGSEESLKGVPLW